MARTALSVFISLILLGTGLPVCLASDQPNVTFKVYSPNKTNTAVGGEETPVLDTTEKSSDVKSLDPTTVGSKEIEQPNDNEANQIPTKPTGQNASSESTAEASEENPQAAETEKANDDQASNKVLQGYIRVVPSGTKVPIVMDTAVDSDTSQEGDEFSARTSEDLNIDGTTIVPAGSIIRGRIAQLNAPKRLDRSGSVALKFDTVTTPDNRQIPLVANLVARGGVVHARRGVKDIAIDASIATLPALAGLGIGLLAGKSSSSGSHLNKGTGAVLGAAIGTAIGVAILMSKKGKKVDVRPGDELKIELAEDLRMPM